MNRDSLFKNLTLIELSGFGLLLLVQWLDELLDFPHILLGAAPTPVNVQECLIENFVTLCLALLVIGLTRRLIKRIRYLEGFLPVCSFCKRIRVDGQWLPLDYYVHSHSEASVTHTVCDECAAREYGEVLDKKD